MCEWRVDGEGEGEERCGNGVCEERSLGGLFKAGRRSVAAFAINTKTTCIPPRGSAAMHRSDASLHAHLATEMIRRLTARATMRRLGTEMTRHLHLSIRRFVWLTGGSYLSEARFGQCPAPRREPLNLEALLAVSDGFWAGQTLCDPSVWPVFLFGAIMEL